MMTFKKTLISVGFGGLALAGLMVVLPPAVPAANPGPTSVLHADAQAAARLIDQHTALVVDVRTPKEFMAGHIAGATNLDFSARDFKERLGKLDRSKCYVVLCRSGRRSTASLVTFKELQFSNVVHLDGGMNAWERAGKPVVK